MNKGKPLKRHNALKPLSRDHHHGLLLCWKIRTGISKDVETERIKEYAEWFFDNHLKKHFETEEKYIFPVLGNDHDLVKKALAEHRRLARLFNLEKEPAKKLSLIEEELESHIRFEERVLFNEIQKKADDKEMEEIEAHHSEDQVEDDWEDVFWK